MSHAAMLRGHVVFFLLLTFSTAWGQEEGPKPKPAADQPLREMSIYIPYTKLRRSSRKMAAASLSPTKNSRSCSKRRRTPRRNCRRSSRRSAD